MEASLTLECWWVIDLRRGFANVSLWWWNEAGIALASLLQQAQLSCLIHCNVHVVFEASHPVHLTIATYMYVANVLIKSKIVACLKHVMNNIHMHIHMKDKEQHNLTNYTLNSSKSILSQF